MRDAGLWGSPVLLRSILLIILVLTAFGVVGKAVADYDEDDEEYEVEAGEELEELGELLGQVAFYLGAVLNAFFVLVRWSRGFVRWPPEFMRLVMELHMYGNLVLGAAALTHGLMFIEYAGLVEYGLGAIVLVLMVSGLFMRYAPSRYARIAARMVHSQRALTILLVVLLILHVGVAED